MDDSLIIYGGTCPKCFGEIPGEEAATDPGEEVKAAQAASDRKVASRRIFLPLFLGFAGIAMVGMLAVGLVSYNFFSKATLMDLNDGEELSFVVDMNQFKRAPEPVPEPVAAPAPGVKPKPGVKPGPKPKPVPGASPEPFTLADPTKVNIGKPEGDGNPVTAPRPGSGVQDPAGLQGVAFKDPSKNNALDLSVGIEPTVDREQPYLDDPDEIREHILKTLKSSGQQLKICVEQRLKLDESFGGKWNLEFVVGKDGSMKEAKAVAVTKPDPAFEDCVQKRMMKWKFYRLYKDQPITKTVTFGAQ